MESVLGARGLRKSFGDTVAVDGVSLSVAPGEIFALVGPNGAGKTTLVRALSGTVTPDDGSVEVFGADPTDVDKHRLSVLPQSFSPPDRLTPREIVDYYAGLFDSAQDASNTLASVGIDPDDETWYEHLSGGQQRRTAVAATLVNGPDLVFLDEPTTGIDPEGRRALWSLLESIADDGTTIFLTTHDMAEAERLADRVGLLSNGRLVETGAPRALIEEFGGESRLVVETTARIDALNGYDVTVEDDRLVVRGIEPADIGAVVDELEAANVAFDALSWREPTLEDAYLALAAAEGARE